MKNFQLFKKASKLTKKKLKSKVSLSPKFLENVKIWPKLLEEEKKAQFEKVNRLVGEKTIKTRFSSMNSFPQKKIGM